MLQRQAAQCAGLFGAHRSHVVGGQAGQGDLLAQRFDAGGRVQSQQAARVAADVVIGDGPPNGAFGLERGGSVESGVRAVLPVHDAVEQPGWIARGFLRRLVVAIDQRCLPALLGQRLSSGAASQTGAEDDRAACRCATRCGCAPRIRAAPGLHARRKARKRGVTIAARAAGAGLELHLEAGGGQPCVHRQSGGPGGHQRGFRCRQARQRFEVAGLPHCQVVARRKVIKKKRIHRGHQLGQTGAYVAERQQQLHTSSVKTQAMQVGGEWRPRGEQGLRE